MTNDGQISEWDKWIKDFLKVWFEGLMDGIEKLDENIRTQILEMTGRACAKAHSTILFEKAWEESDKNIDSFIPIINKKMGGDFYTIESNTKIVASYSKCYCPLVSLGLTDSPALCNCSPNWLKENFEKILGRTVDVNTEKTVLKGNNRCEFTLTIDK